jgi:pyruvate formate lyase activating enzyme
MVIGGLQKFTLSDFPGRVAAVVFTRGCNFRCPYCHNPQLVDPERYSAPLSEEAFFEFLGQRRDQLQGVVVSGGEPTIHDDLPEFLASIKSLGFAIKLDTNGSNPDMLHEVLAKGLVDFLAMDLKGPLSSYPRIAGFDGSAQDVGRSLQTVIGCGIPHEIRTTYHESLLSREDLIGMAALARGCASFVLQGFRPAETLGETFSAAKAPSRASLLEIQEIFSAAGMLASIRD